MSRRTHTERQGPTTDAVIDRSGGRALGRRCFWDRSAMVVALAVWACALPVVFLLVGPLLGLRAAAVTAVALLGAITLVCWAVCVWGVPTGRGQE